MFILRHRNLSNDSMGDIHHIANVIILNMVCLCSLNINNILFIFMVCFMTDLMINIHFAGHWTYVKGN